MISLKERYRNMGCCSSADDINDQQRLWQYEDDNQIWMKMEPAVAKIVEQAYGNNKKQVQITSEYGFKYKIDLKKMTQTNTTSGKSRNIRFISTENVSQNESNAIQNYKSTGVRNRQNNNDYNHDYDDVPYHGPKYPADLPNEMENEELDFDQMQDEAVQGAKDLLNQFANDNHEQEDDFMDQYANVEPKKHIKYDYIKYKQEEKEPFRKKKVNLEPQGNNKMDDNMIQSENDEEDQKDIINIDNNNNNAYINNSNNIGRWQWKDDSDWKDYDSVKCKGIEDAYNNGKEMYSFIFSGKTYEVRLNEMQQYNVKTDFKRQVRRIVDNDSIPKKDSKKKKLFKKKRKKSTKVSSKDIIWQWQDDDGFKNYAKDISDEIEDLYNNKGNNGYGNVLVKKFGTQTYEIQPFQNQQLNKSTQWSRNIRRINIKNQTTIFKWQWKDDSGWKDYDINTSKAVEKSFSDKKNTHQFTVMGRKSYEVRFNTLKQCNLSTQFERDVRRVPLDSISPNRKDSRNNNRNNNNNNNNNNMISASQWKGPKRQTFGKKIMTLYHVTDKKAADAISKSGKMIRGSAGMFGGGIYFAESIDSATYKSEHKGGWVITAKVLVGKEHIVSGASAGKFDYQKLQKLGCDSINAPKGSGGGKPERVVYNWDQVCIVSVKKTN